MSFSSFTVATYRPKDVVMSFGGYVITDWQSMLISRNSKVFTQHKGIGGKNTRVYNPDTSCTIKVRVLQSGMANAIMSEVIKLDAIHKTARLELIVKDNSGESLFTTTTAYITGYPQVDYSENFEWREWEIMCDDSNEFIISGNERPQSAIVDAISSGIGKVGDLFK